MKKPGNTTREIFAAIILLAAVSIFVDFRIEGITNSSNSKVGLWYKESEQYLETEGIKPLEELRRLRQQEDELEILIEGLMKRLPVEESSGDPKETALTPGTN